MKITNDEKNELNKIGNTIDIMGEEVELESQFGNKEVTKLRKNLLKKEYLKLSKSIKQADGTIIKTITLSPKGWNWYYAKG